MDDRENFEKWCAQWDQAQKEIAAEQPQKQVEPEAPRGSYFTGTPASVDYDFDPNSEEGAIADDWHSLYQRAMEVDYSDEGLLTDAVNVAYMGSEGYGKEMPKGTPPSPGGKKVYTNQPVHFASVGNDQQDDEDRTRVTQNWNDGDDLLELDDVKRRVEAMERKFHDADVLDKPDRSKIQNELKSLRERVKKLSEKVQSNPQDDLT